MTDVDSDAFEQWNSVGRPLVHVHARAHKLSGKKIPSPEVPSPASIFTVRENWKSLEQEAIGKVSWL